MRLHAGMSKMKKMLVFLESTVKPPHLGEGRSLSEVQPSRRPASRGRRSPDWSQHTSGWVRTGSESNGHLSHHLGKDPSPEPPTIHSGSKPAVHKGLGKPLIVWFRVWILRAGSDLSSWILMVVPEVRLLKVLHHGLFSWHETGPMTPPDTSRKAM